MKRIVDPGHRRKRHGRVRGVPESGGEGVRPRVDSPRSELDLLDGLAVERYFRKHRPEFVFLLAARSEESQRTRPIRQASFRKTGGSS